MPKSPSRLAEELAELPPSAIALSIRDETYFDAIRGVVDHFAAKFPEASARLAGWLADGSLKLPEHIEAGIESFPGALIRLFTGGHMGKLLVTPGNTP